MIKTDEVREKIVEICEEMCTAHIGEEMKAVIEGGLLLFLSKGHMLLYGPHGSNKSRVIEDLFSRVHGAGTFVLTGSAYATVEDVLGPIKMSGLDEDRYERATDGRLPCAHFAFMDEVLECQDALVKVMHPIMNERKFVNGSSWLDVPLMSMFGATNVTVEDAVDGKAAFIDRWHLRYKIGYPDDPEQIKEIRVANRAKRQSKKLYITMKELQAAQQEASEMPITEEIDNTVCKIFKKCLGKGISVSPRRLAQIDPIIQASAWVRGRSAVDTEDLGIMRHSLWTEERDIEPLIGILATEAKSHASQALELLAHVKKIFKQWGAASKGSSQRQNFLGQVQEKAKKISDLATECEKLNKSTADIDRAYEDSQKILYQMAGTRGE